MFDSNLFQIFLLPHFYILNQLPKNYVRKVLQGCLAERSKASDSSN